MAARTQPSTHQAEPGYWRPAFTRRQSSSAHKRPQRKIGTERGTTAPPYYTSFPFRIGRPNHASSRETTGPLRYVLRTMVGCMESLPSQVGNMLNPARHVKNGWRRVTLFAICTVSRAMNVVLADVVFTCKGGFEIPRAFMKRSSRRAATMTMVNAGCHIGLAFHYGSKTSTKEARK